MLKMLLKFILSSIILTFKVIISKIIIFKLFIDNIFRIYEIIMLKNLNNTKYY